MSDALSDKSYYRPEGNGLGESHPSKDDIRKFLDVFGMPSDFEASERFVRGYGAFPPDADLPFSEVIRVRDWLQRLAD